MINKLTIFVFMLSIVFSQVSMSDLNKLSNAQLDTIRSELKSAPAVSSANVDSNIRKINSPSSVSIKGSSSPQDSNYFGYSYFKKNINFFDNIPTPPNFKLGPGDEIVISLWGETNSRENFVINKEGLIYYQNIGFINLSNKTIKEAESILMNELSQIYSTLNDDINPTEIKVELGKIKSMNVYFTGQINSPGINLVHPFSDVFAAIVQAGGVKNEGSLRKVELIRDGEILSVFDFYSFFIKGENTFSDIRILDGDIIHIPVVSKRINISGPVYSAGFFELLDNESLLDLIQYTGGLKANAATSAILDELIPQSERSFDDAARGSQTILIKDFKSIKPNDGDKIILLAIPEQETKVNIRGRIKSPGEYPYTATLKEVLDIAGGFNDPIYRKTILDDEIIVIRKDENQFYSAEFKVSYDNSNAFKLAPGDQIFVYENSLYNNFLLVTVEGEVNKRGSFQFKKGVTVEDVVALSGGLSELGNKNAIIVKEQFTSLNNAGVETIQSKIVNNATLDFELTKNSKIMVLPLENVVNVIGNVYNPGLIVHSSSRKSVNKYINLAGGSKPNTLKSKIYIKRANGRIKKVSLLRGLGVVVRAGDTIFVPVDPDPQDFDITAFLADLSSTLANIAAILIIADNQNN